MKRFRLLLAGIATTMFGLIAMPLVAHAATTVVKQANLAIPPNATTKVNSWYFYNDNTNAASTAETPNYMFVSGPGTPPAGIGSLKFNLTSATDRFTIATNRYAGDDLSSISTLSFDMYAPSTSSGGTSTTLFLNLDIDFNNTATGGYQGRLIYVPQDNGIVTADTWQTWGITNSSLLRWSGFEKGVDKTLGTADDNKWPDGITTPLRTFASIKTAFPNAEVWNEGGVTGQLLVRAGHPGPSGLVNYVDKVVVNSETFDFEPTVGPPTSKDQCKNDGWKTFNNPTFKNQGDCIDFVEQHGKPEEVKGTLRMSGPSQKIKFRVSDENEKKKNKLGTIEYWNFEYNGGTLHYKADVLCVGGEKSTGEARVMWRIPAGHPGLSDLYVVAYTKEVKNGPDLYGHNSTNDLATATAWCETGTGFTPTMYTVTKGHVNVE